MLKNIVKLESVVEGKVGHFLLDHDTSINIAKEMCLQFLKYLGQVEDQVKEKMEQEKSVEEVESVPDIVPNEEIKPE